MASPWGACHCDTPLSLSNRMRVPRQTMIMRYTVQRGNQWGDRSSRVFGPETNRIGRLI